MNICCYCCCELSALLFPIFPLTFYVFFVSSEQDIHRTSSPTSLRHWICQKKKNAGLGIA